MAKTCAVPECERVIGQWALMCLTHWRRLPREMRNKINTTLRAYKEHMSVETAQEYRDACNAAVAYLTEPKLAL